MKIQSLFLDRLEKTFFYTSLKRNTNKYKIQSDYDDIESLLEGRAFVYGNDKAGSRLKAKVEREDSTVKLYYEILKMKQLKPVRKLCTGHEALITERNDITDKVNNSISIYHMINFKRLEDFVFPHEVNIMANKPGKETEYQD